MNQCTVVQLLRQAGLRDCGVALPQSRAPSTVPAGGSAGAGVSRVPLHAVLHGRVPGGQAAVGDRPAQPVQRTGRAQQVLGDGFFKSARTRKRSVINFVCQLMTTADKLWT